MGLIREMNPEDIVRKEETSERFVNLKLSGICATCEHEKHKNVFDDSEESIIYEDDFFNVKFEKISKKRGTCNCYYKATL